MKQLLILSVCIFCCQAWTAHEKNHVEHLKRELQQRMIERELARDQGLSVEGVFDDIETDSVRLGLQKERVFERRQVIEDCIQGDLIFVVDSSGSIGIENWKFVLDFMNAIIDKVGVAAQGTHVGLVTYGNRAHLQFHLNNFTEPGPMKAAVSQCKFLDENTNTSGGIATALRIMFTKENGDRDKAPNIMVIITDGVSTYDNHTTIPNAVAAKNANILVVCIGVGNKTSQAELDGMASVGKDGKPIVFQVGSYEALELVNTKLANVACDKEETPAVDCPGTSCNNTCEFGFTPTTDGCATCACQAQAKICP